MFSHEDRRHLAAIGRQLGDPQFARALRERRARRPPRPRWRWGVAGAAGLFLVADLWAVTSPLLLGAALLGGLGVTLLGGATVAGRHRRSTRGSTHPTV